MALPSFLLSFLLLWHFDHSFSSESSSNLSQLSAGRDIALRYSCPALQQPAYGFLECDNYQDPYRCTFRCQPGYYLDGPYEVFCENARWRPQILTNRVCIRGDSVSGGHGDGHVGTGHIIGGHGGSGHIVGGQGGLGYGSCPPLKNPVYGYVDGICGPNPRPSDTCYFYCERGYVIQGSPVLRCREDGLWSNQPPLCVRSTSGGAIGEGDLIGGQISGSGSGYRYCSNIEYIEGVSYSGICQNAQPGDRCYMRCGVYSPSSRPIEVVAICLENGYWSNSAPRCRHGLLGSILGEIITRVLPKEMKFNETMNL